MKNNPIFLKGFLSPQTMQMLEYLLYYRNFI